MLKGYGHSNWRSIKRFFRIRKGYGTTGLLLTMLDKSEEEHTIEEKKLPGGKEVSLLNEKGGCSGCNGSIEFNKEQNEAVCDPCRLDFTLDYHKKNSEVPKKE